MEKIFPTILSITGSDGTGGAGIQADVQTISALGGKALTVLTCLSMQSASDGFALYDVPTDLIVAQVQSLLTAFHPSAAKIGLVRDADAIRVLRYELAGMRQVVCDPGLLSARGARLMDDAAMLAFKTHLLPIVNVLLMRCDEAELLLGCRIGSDEDMLDAARRLCAMGPQWLLLRGGRHNGARLTALLYGDGGHRFFSSHNIEGWQQHGVGGAMSSAIATRLAMGDDVPTAVENAHRYMHNQVIFSQSADAERSRPADLYNRFLDIIAQDYTMAHDVLHYASKLSISSRYLSRITAQMSAQTPKQIIDDYLIIKAKVLLDSSALSVQEISNRLGFASQAQFCRLFTHVAGIPPTKYRK